MVQRDRGVIVQVGSALTYRSIQLQATYCGANHAIKGFTEALRCELTHDRSNVKVTMVQLPGLNTPQFGQVKTTLRCHPMPVPPVYQPEVAARAVVWAAEHPSRREVYVGAATPAVIWGGRLVPGLLDRYLARTSYEAQQGPEPVDADRPSYLWEPLPGDRGAHGAFDDIAQDRSFAVRAGDPAARVAGGNRRRGGRRCPASAANNWCALVPRRTAPRADGREVTAAPRSTGHMRACLLVNHQLVFCVVQVSMVPSVPASGRSRWSRRLEDVPATLWPEEMVVQLEKAHRPTESSWPHLLSTERALVPDSNY